jgi:antitoxin VapB
MPKIQVAKLFQNGASQAVRLPAEFRFAGDQVYVTRDEKTNNVILSERPGAGVWSDFFEFVRGIDVPQDWMKERPMNRAAAEDRPVFREED